MSNLISNQHIVKAFFRKTQTEVYLFYEIKSRKYSGHFITKPIKKSAMIQTIEKAFPPTFEAISEYAVLKKDQVDYLYIKPDDLDYSYSFFNQLKAIV